MRPLDRPKMFSRVSRGCFPWGSCGIASPWGGDLDGHTWVSTQKGHNFWYNCWITLTILQGFPEAVFLGVAMESLLRDKEVWSASLKYRLKRAITFDPIVGSRSKKYRGFRGCFLRGSYGIVTSWREGLVSQPWVSAQKGHNFWSDRWIALKILQGFPEAVFLGVAMNRYSVIRRSGRPALSIGSKVP
jgi:hypothetical protein